MRSLIMLLIINICACGNIQEYQYKRTLGYDFETFHEMFVTVGNINTPAPELVEHWTDEAFDFWISKYPDLAECVYKTTPNVHAIFYDREYVIANGQACAGLAFYEPLRIEISYGGPIKIRGVFIHELSHIFVAKCFNDFNPVTHHAFFEHIGLNEFTIY